MSNESSTNIDSNGLESDVHLAAKVKSFHEAADSISKILRSATDRPDFYEKLSNGEKLKYNLLISYGLNTLFWMYLRLEGKDPAKHEITIENDRLKQHMVRAKQIKERETIMPRVNVGAAQRFIRSGLWEPNSQSGPPNKKKKI